jgi:general secretion pathway protein D
MQRRMLLVAAAVALALPAGAQDEDKKLKFNFKDASVDAVLQYVSSVTGWIFVIEKKISGTIEAVSETDVPVSKCLDFLNTALRRHNAVIPNPYSPSLPKPGQILKVQDTDLAKRTNIEIHIGMDTDEIPITDQVRTQIMPLKAVNVVEVNKELGEVLRAAVGADGQLAVSSYSNSIVLTGRSDGINRAARILRVIDVSASAEIKISVFPLKNADATETAKTLNDVFKKESMKAETGSSNPMRGILGLFGGGGGGDAGGGRGGGRGGDAGGPTPRALAHEMVRITAETRTNSVIVSATDDNTKIIAELIKKLDDKTAAAIKLKLYSMRFSDATSVAKLINDLFSETPTNANAQNRQGGRGGGGPVWLGNGQGGAGAEPPGATHEVRAVPDIRTNCVLVAASEQKLLLIDTVMLEIDRPVNDMLVVKVYELKNADPVQMTTVLTSLFRPQVNATQNSGAGSGGAGAQQQGGARWQQAQVTSAAQGGRGGGGGGVGGASTGSGLLPSQEVEITNDPRTRSVIVKASREYVAIIDDVVKQLDANPTETLSTYVVPLHNADAFTLAQTLQNLLRSTQTGSGNQASLQNRAQQGSPLFQGMQNQSQPFGTSSGSGLGSGRGGGLGSGGGGLGSGRLNLGPLDSQEAPLPPQQQPQTEPARGIEGNVDVEADAATNSIIIRTSPRNYRSIQGVLQDLDRLRPQVLIKVLIADVTLDSTMAFGIQGFWTGKMNLSSDQGTNKGATAFPLGSNGFTYSLTDPNSEYGATLNALATEGKLRVLATPRILALDNQTANVTVGQQVPIVSNTTVNSLGNTVNTVTYQTIGIILNVTPHISPDGLVTMIVAPQVSDIASAAEAVQITTGVTSPTFDQNSAQTTVSVRNGTTVIIGGLIRDLSDDTVQKVPVLGDLPLLGKLFQSISKTKQKRELMIFLTPYVAYSAAQLEEITELEKSRLKVIDTRDIEAESDLWLKRIRHQW